MSERDKPDDDPHTQFEPPPSVGPKTAGSGAEDAWFSRASASTEEPTSQDREHMARRPTAHAMIGALLNHIYRVDRFIAAGGMGAVYEGINVNTDERVAVKIILPHLAADSKIQALFRNEARTLTRLSHPGLAQYRVLAYEPLLDVFYIVTEFIDGPPLSDVLSQQSADAAQLRSFAIRLASGLAAAHEWGPIHRDLSPDNILLPLGRLEKAKIIDFGIAKDLEAVNKTVVGSGFAGKFAFVAPEQFGDPDSVGPWTDVYSLGLVLLTVARRAPPPMGASIVDAMEARKSIPDLSALPVDLRDVVAKMLEPDHTKRFQSMRDVVTAFEEPKPAQAVRVEARAGGRTAPRLFQGMPLPALWVLGGSVALAAMFVAAMFVWSTFSTAPAVRYSVPAQPGVPVEEKLRSAIEASLVTIPCTWFDIGYPTAARGGMQVELSGVSGNPDAVARVAAAARAKGMTARVDATGVFVVDRRSCGLLDAFRQFREPSSDVGRALIPGRSQFHLQKNSEACVEKGMRQARIVMDIKVGNLADDFTILGMDAKGGIQQLFIDRASFDYMRSTKALVVSDLGNDSYRLMFCTDQNTALSSPNGLAGLLLIKGRGPFDLGLNPLATDIQTVSPDWPAQFVVRAQSQHWRTQMAWYQVLND
jgi:serine/threonine-protein kinase